MNPLSIGGLGLGVIGAIGGIFGARKANRKLSQLEGQIPIYSANPLAQQRLGLANTLLNARMPGAAQEERNIYGNQANTFNNISRGATDVSQLLSGASAAQGQTNAALGNLGLQEAQDYQRRLQNYNQGVEGQINEGDKVYQSNLNKFGDITQLEGAKAANRANAWGSLSNMGFGLASLGFNKNMKRGTNYGDIGGNFGYAGSIPTSFNPSMVGSTGYINPNIGVPQYSGWSGYPNPYGE